MTAGYKWKPLQPSVAIGPRGEKVLTQWDRSGRDWSAVS